MMTNLFYPHLLISLLGQAFDCPNPLRVNIKQNIFSATLPLINVVGIGVIIDALLENSSNKAVIDTIILFVLLNLGVSIINYVFTYLNNIAVRKASDKIQLDSVDGIKRSINFLRNNDEMCGAVYNLVPLPGTEIMEYARDKNLIDDNYLTYIASYSLKDIMENNYIHLAPNMTREELVLRSKEFQNILKERGKSSYVHQTKFRK